MAQTIVLTRDKTSSATPGPEPLPATRGTLPLTLSLRHGGTIDTILSYERVGPAHAPMLIVAGGISAGRHVLSSPSFPEPGWWQTQAERLAHNHQILAIDWIGADGTVLDPIDPADQAEALALLLDHLAIPRAAAFVGASYGAMVGMHLAARHPHRIGALLAISAADRAHPFASACRALQRQALSLGERSDAADHGVALARALAMLTYRTPEEFARRFNAPPTLTPDGRVRVAAEDYLDHHGHGYTARMSSAAYRCLSQSIDLHRIDPAQIPVPLTLVGVEEDALVPPGDIAAMAARGGADLHILRSLYGHDAFLKEDRAIGAILRLFLASAR